MKMNRWIETTGLTMLLAATVFLAGGPQPATAAPSADVKAVYGKECKKCHGWDGKGQTAMGKKNKLQDWSSAAYQKKASDDKILKVILEGYKDPADPKRKMDGYKGEITEAQAKDLVKVVRAYGTAPGPFPGEK
ncbi:MAG: cytochrome c [Armatimonadetes bacterium]|nr:cytochrome c [Armatimonadota bacterium]